MIKLKQLIREFIDASQAILTDNPVELIFVENFEAAHVEIIQRLYPTEMEKLKNHFEQMGYGGTDDDKDDALYAAANHMANEKKFSRVVIEGDILYFNTYNHQELSPKQLKYLKDYCIENRLELVHSMGMKKRYIDLQ